MLVMDDDGELGPDEFNVISDEMDGSELEPHSPICVSLNSVVGIYSPKTMKLKGRINSIEIVVMVDPGATHNFISLTVISKQRISASPTGKFQVSLGNGGMIGG